MGKSEFYLNKSVVVKFIPDENSKDDHQFFEQFFLHEAVLLAKLYQFFGLVVGVYETALVVLDLVDRASDLDDFQG